MRKVFTAVAVVAAALALAGPATAGVEVEAAPVTLQAMCTPVLCSLIGGNEACQTTLQAGSDDVATVAAALDGTNVTVTFTALGTWKLTSARALVKATNPLDNDPLTACTVADDRLSATCTLPVPAGDCVYFRAGASVTDPAEFEAGLPQTAQMKVTYPTAGAPAYFQTTIQNGGILNGTYNGWCVDTDHTIGNGTWYTANVYSSYESIPAGAVEHPENFDLVNWILNSIVVGMGGVTNPITYGDIQRAIWEFVEDPLGWGASGLGAWTPENVAYIKALAQTSGEGYIPPCGGFIAVVLIPTTATQVIIAQVTVATVPSTCTSVTACFQCCFKGSLSISKAVNIIRHIPATESFEICIQGPSYPETPNCKTFTAGQTLTWTDLLRGPYTITETIAEVGWTVVVDTSPVSVVGGRTANATVTNNYQFCTLTPGYWKTHSEYGPAPYDDTWELLPPEGEDSWFFDSGKTYYQVLWTNPSGGNAYYILAHAYIAAELNTLGGLTSIPEVDAAMAWSRTFFPDRNPEAKLSKDLRAEALAVATILDDYNNGLIGPGHCD
ncbi:MAG: hypothetical protein ACOY3Y_13735 [Acidobacteriota bacterium]